MNIMWTPNKRLGLCGKINSGVDGVTPLSTFEIQMFLLRAVFNLVSKVISHSFCFGFTLLHSVIG